MRVLVTGSTGFVGRHLIPKLVAGGHSVTEVTIEPGRSNELYGNSTRKIIDDGFQENLAEKIVSVKPEIVIHLASYLTSLDDYKTLEKLINSNIHFFCRILDALKFADTKLFINTGSCAEYLHGNNDLSPAYLYSATKTASRYFLKYYSNVYNYNSVTVVPYTIYGGNDSNKKIIDIIIDSLDSQTPVDLSPGDQVLDFIHVDDVAEFYLFLVDNYQQIINGSNYHLGTGQATTIKELAKIVENVTGKKTNINWGAKPYRPSDVLYAVADTKSISNTLTWSPAISLETGLHMMMKKINI